MPILTVEIIGSPPGHLRVDLARRLADAAGNVLGTRPGQTWVRLRVTPAADYAENGSEAAATPAPVFVSIIKHSVPSGDALAKEVSALTAAIAGATGRPANRVHLIYEPPAAGRVAFGATVVA